MNIREQVSKMDAVVLTGDVVEAVKQFFDENATTSDHGEGGVTENKAGMVKKMEDFAGSIAKVNEITLHNSAVEGNISASEYTFDFDMKDGSKVYWHEVIRRIWNDQGKVVEEKYFIAI